MTVRKLSCIDVHMLPKTALVSLFTKTNFQMYVCTILKHRTEQDGLYVLVSMQSLTEVNLSKYYTSARITHITQGIQYLSFQRLEIFTLFTGTCVHLSFLTGFACFFSSYKFELRKFDNFSHA